MEMLKIKSGYDKLSDDSNRPTKIGGVVVLASLLFA